MNDKNITVEKMAYIRQNFRDMPAADIADHLQIDEKRVRNFIAKYCRKNRSWPPAVVLEAAEVEKEKAPPKPPKKEKAPPNIVEAPPPSKIKKKSDGWFHVEEEINWLI